MITPWKINSNSKLHVASGQYLNLIVLRISFNVLLLLNSHQDHPRFTNFIWLLDALPLNLKPQKNSTPCDLGSDVWKREIFPYSITAFWSIWMTTRKTLLMLHFNIINKKCTPPGIEASWGQNCFTSVALTVPHRQGYTVTVEWGCSVLCGLYFLKPLEWLWWLEETYIATMPQYPYSHCC